MKKIIIIGATSGIGKERKSIYYEKVDHNLMVIKNITKVSL